ncbi:MAG TPA: glycine cleavage system aminomethyltransferase GcvT [Burkholderiales bacterium]|nr:glycine cleavage system aminomethyltransferase GcvT [Burkholderiales bacterium]
MTASTLKTTPLNALHRELNARMVDFGGWDMPLHYGSQIEEHHAVRRAAGMFDVSHMLAIDVRGAGSREFLAYVLANNAHRLRDTGKALYSCLLNPAGGVLDDLIVYFFAEDWFRLVVNAGTAGKDCAWLMARRDERAPQLVITPRRDLAIIAVQGPQARVKVYAALPATQAAGEQLVYFSAAHVGDLMLARTGYTGEDGFEIVLPAVEGVALWRRLHEQGVTPAGLGARDTLRLEAGMNLYGQDMDETTTPLETGLAWTVDLKAPRDFIGKRALQDAQATRHALGLVLLDKGVMRSHQKITTAHGDGEITSGGFGPTLERSLALARVPLAVRAGDEVQVAVRDKLLRARVVKPPFVRHGKVLIA